MGIKASSGRERDKAVLAFEGSCVCAGMCFVCGPVGHSRQPPGLCQLESRACLSHPPACPLAVPAQCHLSPGGEHGSGSDGSRIADKLVTSNQKPSFRQGISLLWGCVSPPGGLEPPSLTRTCPTLSEDSASNGCQRTSQRMFPRSQFLRIFCSALLILPQ